MFGRVAGLAAVVGVAVAGSAAGASAAAPPVVVTNLGQPGMLSTVPQPPESLAGRGTCPEARTLEEANGAASPCPAGTWPTPGDAWGPTVEAVRGDALALDFATAPEDVRVTLTSNHPVGLMTPPYPGEPGGAPGRPGDPVLNVAYGPATVARSPDDPRRWLVTVPDSGRPSWARTPMYAAISARTADGGANHVLTLGSGRWVEYGTDCGALWFEPGAPTPFCPRDVIPPGVPPRGEPGTPTTTTGSAPQATPPAWPRAVRTGRPTVRLVGRVLRVSVPGATPGTLRLTATWRGRTWRSAASAVRKSGTVTVRLPVSRSQHRRLLAARRPALRVTTVVAVAGDATPARRTAVVRLARR